VAAASSNGPARIESAVDVGARRRTKLLTPEAAARLIFDGDTLAVGGFVGLGVPEELLIALQGRFDETGGPRDLTLNQGPARDQRRRELG